MVGLVATPGDRADYAPDPAGVRQLSWSVAGGATGPVVELDVQDVADWTSLLIQTPSTGAAANAAVYSVAWFANPQATLAITTDTVVVPVGVGVDVALPCKGPYVKVTSTSITGAGTHPSGGRFRVGALTPQAYTLPAILADDSGASGNIAAASTRTYTAPVVVTGTLRLTMSSSAMVSGNISATVVDATGATRQLAFADTIAAPFVWVASVALPPYPLTIAIRNNDASARGVRMAATVGP